MFEVLIGLSLGINDSIFRLTPFSLVHAIPSLVLVAGLVIVFNLQSINLKTTAVYTSAGLLLYGLLLASLRYSIVYSKKGFIWMPILRQAGGFFLGIIIFISLLTYFKKKSLDHLLKVFLVSSFPFLIFGVIQRFTGILMPYYPRIQGVFYEPSYYGDYLVLAVGPFILWAIMNFKFFTLRFRGFTALMFLLWGTNLLFVESGTAILKVITLIPCLILFYPAPLKHRVALGGVLTLGLALVIFVFQGYVATVWGYAMEILEDPNKFFYYHTYYDRLYPIYPAITSLFSPQGFFGLGFGGDYFEFKNLYPAFTHENMLYTKPTLSFFNSYSSKVILYFGIFGVLWILYLIRSCLRTRNAVVKIALMNTLIATLFGVSNFSLPYIWLWLALSQAESKTISPEETA